MSKKEILGRTLTPGLREKGYLEVEGTGIAVPWAIFGGEKDGPMAVIISGVHSAEFVGVQAAIELIGELWEEKLRGSADIVPLCNRSGFENRTISMVHEDGKNLNRVFPGDPQGSPAERLACALFGEFISKADLFIDLHSGDQYETLSPYAYYLGDIPSSEKSREIVECIDVPRCVRSRSHSGGAYNQAALRGIPSVIIERGDRSLYTREQVDADKADVRNILRRFGVMEGEWKAFPKEELRELDDDAPCAGCWYPATEVGERFRAGDILGEIRDYFGEVIYTHRAGRDGVLLHRLTGLNVLEGDPLIAYGVPVEDA